MSEDGLRMIKDIVTVGFSERVMRQSENDPGIKVTDVVIKPATNKGDNYTSEMFRATVEFVRSAGGNKKEKKPIIVKVEPMSEGLHKELVRFLSCQLIQQ